MFEVKDDLSIHITRGDVGVLGISAKNKDKTPYNFQEGDVIRLGVFEKNKYTSQVLQKDINISQETPEAELFLTSEDTTIGNIINKPVDYWYEIQLNPETNPQTIIGYDEDGAKIFRLYPEGVEEE